MHCTPWKKFIFFSFVSFTFLFVKKIQYTPSCVRIMLKFQDSFHTIFFNKRCETDPQNFIEIEPTKMCRDSDRKIALCLKKICRAQNILAAMHANFHSVYNFIQFWLYLTKLGHIVCQIHWIEQTRTHYMSHCI